MFALSFAMLTFLNVYCYSPYNNDEAVMMEHFIESRRNSNFRVSGIAESETVEYKVSLIFALIYGVIMINLIIKRHIESHTEA